MTDRYAFLSTDGYPDEGPNPLVKPPPVEEASPEECKEITLRELELAKNADSLDHMLIHIRSAEIWAKGANW